MFDILKKIKKMVYKVKKNDNKVDNKEWVECLACGYKGMLKDFLYLDSSDTKCPLCGEDIQIFNV